MSGTPISVVKVVGPSNTTPATSHGSTSSVTSTVTVTNTSSSTSRMLVPAVLIQDRTPNYPQYIPLPKTGPVYRELASKVGQASSSVHGLLTPVITQGVKQTPQGVNSPATIVHTIQPLANPKTAQVVHAVMPQIAPKFKLLTKGAQSSTTGSHEVTLTLGNSAPPPLQPLSAPAQIINLNQLKQTGNQFTRIQPYLGSETSEKQNVVNFQMPQHTLSSFVDVSSTSDADVVEIPREIPLSQFLQSSEPSSSMVDLQTLTGDPNQEVINIDMNSMKDYVNEFPHLITIHGLTVGKDDTDLETTEQVQINIGDEIKELAHQEIKEKSVENEIISSQETISNEPGEDGVKTETLNETNQVLTSSQSSVEDVKSTEISSSAETTCTEQSDKSEVSNSKVDETKVESTEENKNVGTDSQDQVMEIVQEELPKKKQFKRPSILGPRRKPPTSTVSAEPTPPPPPPPIVKKTVPEEVPLIENKVIEPKQEVKKPPPKPKKPKLGGRFAPLLDEKKRKAIAEDFDPVKLLDWQDGVGALPGSNLKFKMNEFGFMEIVEGDEAENGPSVPQSAAKPSTSKRQSPIAATSTTAAIPITAASEEMETPAAPVTTEMPKKRPRKEKLSSDDIYCCENCGCYGLACEFKSQRFCCKACEEATAKRRAAIGRRAIELEELKLKRRRKRQLTADGQVQVSDDDTTGCTPDELPSSQADSVDLGPTPASTATPGSTAQNSPVQTPAVSDEEKEEDDQTGAVSDSAEATDPLLPWQIIGNDGKTQFSWPRYLEHLKARAAPTKLFPDNGFPYQRNGFRPGMRLEGIDPRTPSQICALAVSEVKGYRLKLHFEGWSDVNDFWVNADSKDIFAVGFCEKTGRSLVPPRGYSKSSFSWSSYLKLLHANPAPRQLFPNRATAKNSVGPSGFRLGMKLEAVDRQNLDLVCVATVADILDGRILIHFDSWDNSYDYWVEPTSPYIHPIHWCDENNRKLTPPNGYSNFNWENYMKETKSYSVHARTFKPKQGPAFKKGMKLECVDPRFPELIRVATVNDCKEHRIQISFDGWPIETAVWLDSDSPDIHPMGWCNKTGHPLTPPPGPNQEHPCLTSGCRALLKNSQFILPHSSGSCPLSTTSLNKPKKAAIPVAKEEPKESVSDHDEVMDWTNEDAEVEEKPVVKKRRIDNIVSSTTLRKDVHQSVFNPGYSPSPVETTLNWSKHATLLNIDTGKNQKPIKSWSPEEVEQFVKSIPGCANNSKIFLEENIDGIALLMLSQSDFINVLGFKVGPAIKLFSSITLLKQTKCNQ